MGLFKSDPEPPNSNHTGPYPTPNAGAPAKLALSPWAHHIHHTSKDLAARREPTRPGSRTHQSGDIERSRMRSSPRYMMVSDISIRPNSRLSKQCPIDRCRLSKPSRTNRRARIV